MLSTDFAPLAEHPVELAPERLREEIDALNERLYDDVNNAVYKAGFTTRQEVYEREVRGIFAALDEMDERLGSTPLPVRRRAAGDRLAPVHDARALRRRLRDPLQVLAASGSSTTPTCGRTCATSTSGRGWRRRCASTRSGATTSARIRRSTRAGSSPSGRSRTSTRHRVGTEMRELAL